MDEGIAESTCNLCKSNPGNPYTIRTGTRNVGSTPIPFGRIDTISSRLTGSFTSYFCRECLAKKIRRNQLGTAIILGLLGVPMLFLTLVFIVLFYRFITRGPEYWFPIGFFGLGSIILVWLSVYGCYYKGYRCLRRSRRTELPEVCYLQEGEKRVKKLWKGTVKKYENEAAWTTEELLEEKWKPRQG